MITQSQFSMRGSELIGKRVMNAAGEDLGKVGDIVVDVTAGKLLYAVLSFGGVLGIGDKRTAIPMSRLGYDSVRDVFLLNVEKEMLEQAPSFDESSWPNLADQEWGRKVHSHYGTTPDWDEAAIPPRTY